MDDVPRSRLGLDERRGNFTSWSEQKKAADDLARRFATHRLTVAFPNDGYFVDHDRVIYLHLKVLDASRFYKVILGQGLFGFDAACRRRSHGVWFEIDETEWNASRKN